MDRRRGVSSGRVPVGDGGRTEGRRVWTLTGSGRTYLSGAPGGTYSSLDKERGGVVDPEDG